MIKESIFPPGFDDALETLKSNIFANINCIQIGKIESVNTATQTAEVQIQVKRRVNETELISYPLLVDCPIIVLQGGGSYFDLPISTGDHCIILFNDRDIDDWWIAASEKEPRTLRKHSLSDGFILTGINPKSSVLALDGTNLNIWGPAGGDRIQITPSGGIEIGSGGKAAARVDDTTIVDGTSDPTIVVWMSAVTAALVTLTGGSFPATPPATISGKINTGSLEVTIK